MTIPGLMQDWPLTLDRLLEHAAKWHGDKEIVWRGPTGVLGRKRYAAIKIESKRVSNALLAHGIKQGDRVGTLAMNSVSHLEAWYAIVGIGAVCHTLNPRMALEQLVYIINHAEDRVIFADGAFASTLAQIVARCPTVEKVVLFSEPTPPDAMLSNSEVWDTFLAPHDAHCQWGGFDETSAAGLCYTSGTTGDPKGVLYSHRSNFLHTLMTLQPDVFGLSVNDTILPIVPMYHANAWGLTYAAPAVGARLVLPGARLDGASLFELMESEKVTLAAAVPTVWLSLLQHLIDAEQTLTTLRRVIVGGAACPENLIRAFASLGIEPIHAWGMTEMSPVGTVSTLTSRIASLPFEEQVAWRIRQGRCPCGVDLKIVDENGASLPHDDGAAGYLRVRGAAVAAAYFRNGREMLDSDGYFDTGDIASIDPEGFIRITDRAKDVIKSGGEWISSQELENQTLMHPKVALCAAVGEPHDKWGERPVLFVKLIPGGSATAAELTEFLKDRVVRWWIPDAIVFVDAIPLGPTGKVDKRQLRQQLGSDARNRPPL